MNFGSKLIMIEPKSGWDMGLGDHPLTNKYIQRMYIAPGTYFLCVPT